MERVVIVGCGGAGKSTLARALAERTGLPVVHLDRAYWKAGWVEATKEEFNATHAEAIAGERWIIDGNYMRTLDQRAAKADTIILLDMPTLTCVTSILWRYWTERGRTRADMNEGCVERLDWIFFKWVLRYRRDTRPTQLAKLEEVRAGKTMYVLRSRREVRRWLATIDRSRH